MNETFSNYTGLDLFAGSRINEVNTDKTLFCGADELKLSIYSTLDAEGSGPVAQNVDLSSFYHAPCNTELPSLKYCHHPGVAFSNYPQPLDYVYNDKNEVVQFSCDQGYLGGGTLKCDPEQEIYELTEGSLCRPLSCGNTSVENSNFSTSGSIKGTIEDVVNVECNDGFWGGGPWTCLPSRVFKGKVCSPISHTQEYAKEISSCDFDGDGQNDKFPDHSMVLEYKISEWGERIFLPLSRSESLFNGPVEEGRHTGDVDVWVDWGDGTCERIKNDNFTREHRYEEPDAESSTIVLNNPFLVKVIGRAFSAHNGSLPLDVEPSIDIDVLGKEPGALAKSQSKTNNTTALINIINLGDLKLKSLKSAFYENKMLTTLSANYD